MRKFIAIVFLLIYVNVGLAMAINLHFCSGHLSQVSLAKIDFHPACCCTPKAPVKKCCKDESVLLKADKHQAQTSFELPLAGGKILPLPSSMPRDEQPYCLKNQQIHPSFTRLRNYRIADIFLVVRNLRI